MENEVRASVQEAFDNSPLTLWRTGEAIRPGMYVQAEMSETADGVLIEASPDQSRVRLRLEGRDGRREWHTLAEAPRIFER